MDQLKRHQNKIKLVEYITFAESVFIVAVLPTVKLLLIVTFPYVTEDIFIITDNFFKYNKMLFSYNVYTGPIAIKLILYAALTNLLVTAHV